MSHDLTLFANHSQLISSVLPPVLGASALDFDASPCQEIQAYPDTTFLQQFQWDSADLDPEEANDLLYTSLESEKLKRRRGRPSTLQWYDPRKRKLGNLKISRSVSRTQVQCLFEAAAHAPRIHRDLNGLLTLKPERIERVDPAKRSEFWRLERNRLAQIFRDRGDHLTCILSRESNPVDGSSEHAHVLLHLPRGMGADVRRRLQPFYDGSGELDLRPASTLIRWSAQGKHRSVVGYIVKNLNPNVLPGTNLSRVPGGPIVGVRVGVSRDLTAQAIAAWEAHYCH